MRRWVSGEAKYGRGRPRPLLSALLRRWAALPLAAGRRIALDHHVPARDQRSRAIDLYDHAAKAEVDAHGALRTVGKNGGGVGDAANVRLDDTTGLAPQGRLPPVQKPSVSLLGAHSANTDCAVFATILLSFTDLLDASQQQSEKAQLIQLAAGTPGLWAPNRLQRRYRPTPCESRPFTYRILGLRFELPGGANVSVFVERIVRCA